MHGFAFSLNHQNAKEKQFVAIDDDEGYEDGIRPLMNGNRISLVTKNHNLWHCYIDDTTRDHQEPFNAALHILLMHICGIQFSSVHGHGIILFLQEEKTSQLFAAVQKYFTLFKNGASLETLRQKDSFDVCLSRIDRVYSAEKANERPLDGLMSQ